MQETKTIHDLLKNLDSLDKIRELISILGFSFADKPLSTRDFKDMLRDAIAPESLRIIGDAAGFPVIFFQKAKKEKGDIDRQLFRLERELIKKLPAEYQDTCVLIAASPDYSRLHFINPKRLDKKLILRRYIVGLDQNMRTAGDRLSYLRLQDVSRWDVVQERVEKAFDVEEVTKEFFKVFADLYHKVADDIASVKGLEDKAGKLAQLLLDRMIFLYFIQKKGWLNQDKNYLYDRFETCWDNDPKGCNYYSDFLFPLFLSLADADLKPLDGAHVPFLNGGLFEDESKQDQIELLAKARLNVRNKTFREVFDRLLEKFNFTVTEHTPYDIEVAIDPEMLGKIFESLILQLEKDPDKDLRKLTGSYYTPRPIVHFMCQEALKEYLVSQLAGDDSKQAEKYREKIDTLMDMPTAYQIDEETESTLSELFTKPEAKLIRQAVLDCRVCDPAVGSGAFPIGMLHEMIGVISRIDLVLKGKKALSRRNHDYDLKKQIIENCIYGVDIQEQAVRLCELRLWLSLIVDYEIDKSIPFDKAIRQVPSLPNLSYRIVQGDSLLERLFGHVIQLDKLAEDAATKQLIESIQADKSAYFREGKTKEKRRLELKILTKQADLAERLIEAKKDSMTTYQTNIFGDDGMSAKDRKAKAEYDFQLQELDKLKLNVSKAKSEIKKLSGSRTSKSSATISLVRKKYFQNQDSPTFIWRVDFAEVFSINDGFDIVIGNPPYGIDFSSEEKSFLKSKYSDISERLRNSFLYFTGLGFNLLKPGACLSYIMPNEFLFQIYMSKARRFFLNNSYIRYVVNFGDTVFDAVVPVCIIGLVKPITDSDISDYEVRVSDMRCIGLSNLPAALKIEQFQVAQKDSILSTPNQIFTFDAKATTLLNRLVGENTTLMNYCDDIANGISTSCDKIYIVPKELIIKEGFEERYCHESIRGGQFTRYSCPAETGDYILYVTKEFNKSIGNNIYDYLKMHKALLIKKCVEKRKGNRQWHVLFRARNAELFKMPKIIVRQTGDSVIAAIDEKNGYYCIDSVNVIKLKKEYWKEIYYILAVLNSNLIDFVYKEISQESGRVLAQVKPTRLKELPINMGTKTEREKVKELVKKLIDNKFTDTKKREKIESEINMLIYKIYSVSHDEKMKVELV